MARARTGTLKLRTRAGKPNWFAQLTVDKADGSTAREWYSLETDNKTVAKRKLKRLVASQSKPTERSTVARVAARADTVSEYAAEWIARRAAGGIVSARDEKRNLDAYLLPHIGPLPLSEVRAAHVNAALEAALDAGLSRETLKKIRGVALRLFDSAWKRDLCDANPVLKSEVPEMREAPKKERAILTDTELAILLSFPTGDIELKMLVAVARTVGGARTSDLNRLDWSAVDTVAFVTLTLPRSKTGKPQRLEVPEAVRPFLREWWSNHGSPDAGPVFPSRRGESAGQFKIARGISYAGRLRRDLGRALEAHRERQARALGIGVDGVPAVRHELFVETAHTLPVDFHSCRRAYASALAESGVNVQHAMHLAAHSDAKVHGRYVMSTDAMGRAPASAIPTLPGSWVLQQSATIQNEKPTFSARHAGIEPATFGFGGRHSIQLS